MSKKGLSTEEKENLKKELHECIKDGSYERAKEIVSILARDDPSIFMEILSMLDGSSGGGGGGGGGDAGGLSSRWDDGALLDNILSDDPESAYARLSEACEVLALSDERFIRRNVNVPKTVSTLVSIIEIYSASAPLTATVAVRCMINILEAWPDASAHILSAGGVRTVSNMLQNALDSFDIDLMETAISFLNRMCRDHPAEVRAGGALGVLIGIFEFFDLTRQELILTTALLATRGLTNPAEARECFGGQVFQTVVGMLSNDSPGLRITAVSLLLSLVKPLAGVRGDFTRTYYTPDLIMKLLTIVSDAAGTDAGGELGQSTSTSSGLNDDDDDDSMNPEAAAAAVHDDMPIHVKAAELLGEIFAVAPDTYAKILMSDGDNGKRFMDMMLACLDNLARHSGSNSAVRTELVKKVLDALSKLLPQLPASWKTSVPSTPGIFKKSGASRRHHSPTRSGGSGDSGKGSDGESGKKKKRRKKESADDTADTSMGEGDSAKEKAASPVSSPKPKEKKGFSLFSLFSRHSKKGTPPTTTITVTTDDKKSSSSSSSSSSPTLVTASPVVPDRKVKKSKKKEEIEEVQIEEEDADFVMIESTKDSTPANGPLMEFGCNTMRLLAELGIRALAPVKERVFMVLSQVVHGICMKNPSGLSKCTAFDADAVARVSCFVAEAMGLGTIPCVCCSLRVAGFLFEALGREGVTQAWRREGVVHQLRTIANGSNDSSRKKARSYAAWLCDTIGVIDKATGVGSVPFPELVARAASSSVPESKRAAAVAQLIRLATDEGSELSVYDAVEADFTQALALYFLGARCASELRAPRTDAKTGAAIAKRLKALYKNILSGENKNFAALVKFANKVLTKCEALPMPTNTAEDIAATLKMAKSLKIVIKRDPEETTLPEFPVTSPIGIDASAVGKSIQEYIWSKLRPRLSDDDSDDDGEDNNENNNSSTPANNGNYKLVVKMNGVVIGQSQPFVDILSSSFHSSKSKKPSVNGNVINLSAEDANGSREYAELLMSIQNITYRLPTAQELKIFNEEGESAAFLSYNVENNAKQSLIQSPTAGSDVIPLGTDPLVYTLQHYTPMIELNNPMAFTLVLLHVLQCITRYGIAYSEEDDEDETGDDYEEENSDSEDEKMEGNKNVPAIKAEQRCVVPVDNDAFVNASIAEKLRNCFKHIPSVVSGRFPLWCQAVPLLFGFLLPDDLRHLAFVCNYCGVSRSLNAVAERYPEIPMSKELGRLTELSRIRFSVERNPTKYISYAAKMVGPGRSLQQLLDVSFSREAGTGLGPTTEFFALLGQEFTAAGLKMWFQDAAPDSDGHLVSAEGLFPLPYPEEQLKAANSKKGKSDYVITDDVLGLFELLGTFTAKSLLDNKILGVPFSRPFLKWMTGAPLEHSDLAGISPSIGKTFGNLLETAAAAAAAEAAARTKADDSASDNDDDDDDDSIKKVDEEEEEEDALESAEIPFELPGVPNYPLSEGLSSNTEDGEIIVTMKNISTYAERVVDGFFGSGVRAQLSAFKAGFDRVLPMESLRVLSLAALEALVCGSQDAAWDAQSILDSAKFEHGYSRTSRVVQDLAQVMEEFSEEDRRHFVRFLTGSPRLPAGGFAGLNPRFTISKKTADSVQEADKYLPSVNCCFHNIKFTEYSSKEVLRKKLLCAIYDGQGAFDFS